MLKFLKTYYPEILVFGVIALVLLVDQAPNYTWINTDSDGVHYVYSSHFLYPAHKGSAPLYLLLGHLFLYLPFGTEFWRMALISVLSGIAGCVLIYLIIKLKVQNRWYALIGSLIYGGSALAISQNTIVESYPLVTSICLAIYLFCLKGKWLTASILIGVAGAIHPTAMLVIIPMLIAYKPLRNWKRLAVMASFILFYLYIPITNRPPYMWNTPNSEGGIFGFLSDSVSTATMLSGGLAIMDMPKRLLDAGGLILLNFAVIGIVPLFYAFKNKNWWRTLLFWLVAIPTFYYCCNLAPQTAVYVQPSIAFGAVAVGIGLSKLNKKMVLATASCAILFLGVNGWYFDIGNRLDPNLSATKYYQEELPKVPNGDILMPQYGWEWAAIYLYNANENRHIIPVCVDTLVSPEYKKILASQGVNYKEVDGDDRLNKQNAIALSIVELNDNVWTTKGTDIETYGCEIVKARGNEDLLLKIPTEPAGQWHWIPSNPYKIIDGSLEVAEWKFITLSNHNAFFFLSLLIYAFGLTYLVVKFLNKRNAKDTKEIE
jgi:hypothetical protein